MPWNYRIIFHDLDPDPTNHWYGLHEAYYAPGTDTVNSWTTEPCTFGCALEEGRDGIVGSLERALKSLNDPRFSEILKESELATKYGGSDGDATG